MLGAAKRAQNFIVEKGRTEIRKVAKGFVSDMSALIDQYSRHVVDEVSTIDVNCKLQIVSL